MSAYRSLLIGAAIGVLAGGGAIYLHLRALPSGGQPEVQGAPALEAAAPRMDTRPLDEASSERGEDMAALRRQVQELQTAVVALRDELRRLDARRAAQPATGAAADTDDLANQPDLTWEQEAEAARRQLQQHFDNMDAAHRNEYQDPTWSAAAAAQIEDALVQEEDLASVEMLDIDCRTTRCRFEIWFDEDTDIDEVEMALAGSVADAPRMAIHYVEDSADGAMQRAIVYLGREDADFAGQ